MHANDARVVEVAVEIVADTDLALLVSDGDRQAWLPKSQLIDYEDSGLIYEGKAVTLTMPEWLAKDKGLI